MIIIIITVTIIVIGNISCIAIQLDYVGLACICASFLILRFMCWSLKFQTYVKQVNLNQFNNNNNSSSSSSSNNINNSNNIIITVTIVVTEISETVLDMGKEITCVNMVKFKENKTNTTTDRIQNIALVDNQMSKSCQVINNCENAIFIQCKK